MRHFLAILLLLAAAIRSHGAAGDIIGQSVDARGWVLDLNADGVTTNGTFDLGWTNYNTLKSSSPKVVLTLTSPGYDTNGNETTVTRTIYGGRNLRMPWPGDDYPATEDTATGADIHISLSDYVYASDSDLTLSVAAGMYDDGSVETTLLSATSVTNNSTLTYPKARFRWDHQEFLWVTGATMSLRISADHPYGWDGGTMASVWFIASTNGTPVATNKVSQETAYQYPGSGLWQGLYQTSFDTLLFPSNEVRVDVVLYPKLGDSNAVFDTRLNEFTGFVIGPRALTNFVDVGGNYGGAVAVVDYINGNDTNGRVTNVEPASVLAGHYFKSGSAAWNAIAAWNNSNRGHNDVGAGRLYYRAGTTNLNGGTLTATTIPKTYAYALAYPGDTVVWTNNAGTDDVADRLWVRGITIGYPSGVSGLNGIEALVIDNCEINSASTVWSGSDNHMWVVDCNYVRSGQSLGVADPDATVFFGTGNRLQSAFASTVGCATYLAGNAYVGTTPVGYRIRNHQVSRALSADWAMFKNNAFLNAAPLTTETILLGGGTNTLVGFTFSGNIVESVTNNFGAGNMLFFGTQSEFQTMGAVFRHNTVLGKRHGFLYNDSGNALKHLNFVQGNILEILGIKTDDYVAQENSDFTNNWSFVHMVGCNGNVRLERTVDMSAGNFDAIWDGLNSYYNRSELTFRTNTIAFPQFINDNSYDGSGAVQPGLGDYRLKSASPIRDFYAPWTTVVDLYGNTRSVRSPAGAVSALRREIISVTNATASQLTSP